MNFLANITEAVGGLFGNAPSSSSSATGLTTTAPTTVLPAALVANHGEIGGIVSISSFDPRTIFDCYNLFIDSATSKRVLSREKQKLVIAQSQLILLSPLPVRAYSARVIETHELQALAKLKYHKGSKPNSNNSISQDPSDKTASLALLILELKNNKVLSYAMSDSDIVVAVDLLKQRMGALGISGSVTRPLATRRVLQNATQCLAASQEIQTQFSLTPSRALIEEMMSLLRTATELYGTVENTNDELSRRCVEEIHKFLERDDVRTVLEERQPQSSDRSLSDVLTETQTGPDEDSSQSTETTAASPGPGEDVSNPASPSQSCTASTPSDTVYTSPPRSAAPHIETDAALHQLALQHIDAMLSPQRRRETAQQSESLEQALPYRRTLFFDDRAALDEDEESDEDEVGRAMAATDDAVGVEHELSALLEDMEMELRQIVGDNAASAAAQDNKDYQELGLEDFERLIDDI